MTTDISIILKGMASRVLSTTKIPITQVDSDYDVDTMTDQELEDVIRTNARGVPMTAP